MSDEPGTEMIMMRDIARGQLYFKGPQLTGPSDFTFIITDVPFVDENGHPNTIANIKNTATYGFPGLYRSYTWVIGGRAYLENDDDVQIQRLADGEDELEIRLIPPEIVRGEESDVDEGNQQVGGWVGIRKAIKSKQRNKRSSKKRTKRSSKKRTKRSSKKRTK